MADTFSPEKVSEMPRLEPPYPAAFRQQMVVLMRAGRGMNELAREYACIARSFLAWVKAASGVGDGGATGVDARLSMNERHALIELSGKFKRVQQVRDILAKATAWFAAKRGKTPMSSANL